MRRWAGPLVLSALVAVLWLDVAASGPVSRLDAPVLAVLREHRSPALTAVFSAVTDLGGGGARTVLAAAVAGWAALGLRRWWPVVVTGAVLVVSPPVDEALKALTGRARPPVVDAVHAASGLAFPSGHAMGST